MLRLAATLQTGRHQVQLDAHLGGEDVRRVGERARAPPERLRAAAVVLDRGPSRARRRLAEAGAGVQAALQGGGDALGGLRLGVVQREVLAVGALPALVLHLGVLPREDWNGGLAVSG